MRSSEQAAIRSWRRSATAAALASLVCAGCAPAITRNGISDANLAQVAEPVNLPGVRFWADEVPADPVAEIQRRTPHMPRIARNAKKSNSRPIVETLALSGGGADGAFGAGVLAGWTERGDRPEFEVVTGVSAGAIIAPFAFLGPSEDENLRRIWTEYRANEVATAQFIPALFGGASALTDTTPLAKLVAQYIDRATLDRIAAEYNRGRILMVLTTNLDAQRPVVWNMGEIARIGTDEALDLFRKVILASAAIPGAFPPVNISVMADGKIYEELHVDGGTTREIFVLPVQAPFKAFDVLYPTPPIRKLYLIKNGKLTPEQSVVTQSTLPIAGRAISTLIKSQNWSELYRIYRLANDDGADFNLIYVPAAFNQTTKEIYDPVYQKALYDEGLAAGRDAAWSKAPPGNTPLTAPHGRGPKTQPENKVAPSAAAPAKAPLPPKTVPSPNPDAPSAWTPAVKPVASAR